MYTKIEKLLSRSLIVCLSFLMVFTASASNVSESSSLKATVSVMLENASVEQLFLAIQRQTDFSFVYDESIRQTTRKSFYYPQNTVEFILNDLKKEGYSYKNINSTITITRSSSIQQTIHGVVKDPDGIPLPGATVMLKGVSQGTTTDFDGKFELKVNQPSGTLVISFIGYKILEVPFRIGTSVSVTLQEDVNSLDEVVVNCSWN